MAEALRKREVVAVGKVEGRVQVSVSDVRQPACLKLVSMYRSHGDDLKWA